MADWLQDLKEVSDKTTSKHNGRSLNAKNVERILTIWLMKILSNSLQTSNHDPC